MEITLSELSEVKGIGKKTIQRIREYKLADDGYISKYDENLHLDRNSVNQGDCLELMNGIPDKSVDMILADLPYGTTACKWDSIIPLDKLWLQYERIIKDNGAIVLTASQPFTNTLISSNKNLFRYCWYWNKNYSVGFMNANKMPLMSVEEVIIFYKKIPTYNPQGIKKINKKQFRKKDKNTTVYNDMGLKEGNYIQQYTNYPNQVIKTNKATKGKHPTQKPVALFGYLIKTYTNKGDLVLDNVAGSGTTGVACQNADRDYILIEKEQKYIDVIKDRLES